MQVAYYNQASWGTNSHPAGEFWAERHIKYNQDSKRTYVLGGAQTAYFPFGGGANIFPGRHLVKLEVLTAIALTVTQFDIDLVGWTCLDGSPSDRAAEGDIWSCGAGAMPPGRDMRIRWRYKNM